MRNESRDSHLAVNDSALRVTDDGRLCPGTPGVGSSEITAGKVNVLPKSAKVVIIGGGALGTSAAFHLTDAGQKDIVLLDRGPVAGGTTPQAAGQTSYLSSDRFALEYGRYCVGFFEKFEQHTGHPIDFRQSGSLRVARTEKYCDDLAARLNAADGREDVEFISGDRARELVPTFTPSDDCQILSIPRDGYVEPRSVAVAFSAAARDRGCLFQTRLESTGLVTDNGRVTAVQTTEGTIETDWVVLAAGAWTRHFAAQLGLNLRSVPVRHQAFVTAPLPDVCPLQPVVRITEPQLYVRQEAGGLLVGGYGYRPMSFDMSEFPRDFEISALPADTVYYQQLRDQAKQFFPSLVDAVTVQERRGLPTISPDGRLVLSEPGGLQRLVVVSACGVGGIDRSPGAGRLVADIICNREPWIDPGVLNVDRFGDDFASDASLRAQCEHTYAHHYHEFY
ncbi:MAG: FAD-binding oxidoreductase [Fuerstiella sp.]|nr:FAD-binding oxidoreductase [Fuerstiella sp.]